MAMTKADADKFERVHVREALRWPTFENPKPMTPAELDAAPKTDSGATIRARRVTPAWFFNSYSGTVTRGWITATACNSSDPDLTQATGSRTLLPAYRTENEAYRALRWAMCENAAKLLRLLDLRHESITKGTPQ
jgi:hypothetical protein